MSSTHYLCEEMVFFFFRKFVEISKELHLKQWFNWIETNNSIYPTVLLLDLIPNLIDIRDVVLEVNIVVGPKCSHYMCVVYSYCRDHKRTSIYGGFRCHYTDLHANPLFSLKITDDLSSVKGQDRHSQVFSYQTTATNNA